MILTLSLGPQMTILPEALGKRIVVNLELSDSLILIGSDTQELGLLEGGCGVETTGHDVLKCEHVCCWYHVDPHVIFVH